jgi:hypothetical protein
MAAGGEVRSSLPLRVAERLTGRDLAGVLDLDGLGWALVEVLAGAVEAEARAQDAYPFVRALERNPFV